MKRMTTSGLMMASMMVLAPAVARSEQPTPATVAATVQTVLPLDPALGQLPESIAQDRAGNLYVSLANTVAKVTPDGQLSTLATLPVPAAAFATGVKFGPDGSLYVSSAAFDPSLAASFVWRIAPATGDVEQVAALDSTGFPNDLAFDADGNEIWGLVPPIIEIADRCAAAGYRALVPDLFRGKRARDLDEGLGLMAALDFADATEQDVRGAAQWLKRTEPKLATLGFCMGGVLALMAGARVLELDAAVCFYGIPAPDVLSPAELRIPLQGHFARLDGWCTPAKVDELEAGLRTAGVDHELHRYDAAHAFMNAAGHGYCAPSAELAWQRTLEFLERKLG